MSKVFDYSIEFYTWCKKLISTDYKLFSNNNSKRATAAFQAIITESNMNLLRKEHLRSYFHILEKHILHNKSEKDRPKTNNLLGEYERIMDFWEDENSVKIFITALEFILLKDDLLASIKQLETDELDRSGLNPLSLTYDNISLKKPYALRIYTILKVNELVDQKTSFTYQEELEKQQIDLKGAIINILIESINQSIKSDAGTAYESKIETYLTKSLGIQNIERLVHSETGSIEHDFKFELNNKKISVSAKRTLRERYKQYVNLVQSIPTLKEENLAKIEGLSDTKRYLELQQMLKAKISRDIDAEILITITLGTDLTESKARRLRLFGVYVFIAAEVYEKRQDLKDLDGIYSINDLTIEVLSNLV